MKITASEIIKIFYKVILCRDPDSDGLKHHTKFLNSIDKIAPKLKEILYSDEFSDVYIKNKMQLNYIDFLEKKPKLIPLDGESKFYDKLFDCALKLEDKSYLEVHKRRFHDLICTLDECLRHVTKPRLLEIGPSVATRIYSVYMEKLNINTIDRPVHLGGIDEKCALKLGSSKHYNIDLNLQSINSSSDLSRQEEYDYVVCTEVLEHLTVCPYEFVEGIISILKPGGYLYLTTPNFFSHHNCKLLYKQKNPQELYPKKSDNLDAHYHHREYEMMELCEIFKTCGGNIVYSYWSDCWDEKCIEKLVPNCMFSNLVFLVKKLNN